MKTSYWPTPIIGELVAANEGIPSIMVVVVEVLDVDVLEVEVELIDVVEVVYMLVLLVEAVLMVVNVDVG